MVRLYRSIRECKEYYNTILPQDIIWSCPQHLLYVDDMLIVRQDMKKIGNLKKALTKSFAMKDMGSAKQILVMHIVRDRTKSLLCLSQEKYVTTVLQRFNMQM